MQKTLSLQLTTLLAALAFAFALALPAHAESDHSHDSHTHYDEIEIAYSVADGETTVDVEYEKDDEETEVTYTFETTDLDEVWESLAGKLDLSVDDIEDILAGEYEGHDEEEEEDEKDDEEEDDKEEAAEEIEEAEEAIAEVVAHIEEEEEDGKDTENLQNLLGYAEDYLETAEEAYEDEDYYTAIKYAHKAQDKADYILGQDGKDDKKDKDYEWEDKVYVCHDGKTLKIAASALDSHLDHGDTKGKCDNEWKDKYEDKKKYDYSDFGKSSNEEELRAQLELLIDLLIELLRARL